MRENDNLGTLSEKVSNKIKRRISDGEWNIGDKIPNEQILAEDMNVSRTTIREAVKLLISAGVLRIERGVGTFVLNKPDLSVESDDFYGTDANMLVHDICEYRVHIEPIACELAAQRAKENQIRELADIVLEMSRISSEMKKRSDRRVLVDKLAMTEIKFHTAIYQMTNNIMFQRIGKIMNSTVFETYMTDYYRSGIISDRLNFVDVHTDIFYAIRDHDAESASAASKRHMAITYRELVESNFDK